MVILGRTDTLLNQFADRLNGLGETVAPESAFDPVSDCR